jgi:Tat protein translocase TatB subunit
MNFLGMGPLELLLILALALIVFGPDKLPEIARQLGRSVNQFRRMTSDVRTELQRGLQLDDDATKSGSARPSILPPATPSSTAPPRTSPPPDDLQPPY